MNPMWWIDWYKSGHYLQYPRDTEQVWSNWTARSTRVPGQGSVVFFGLQYAVKKILINGWSKFFWTERSKLVAEYREVLAACLGVKDAPTDHIEYLHKLGHLPLQIWALPEGDDVPIGVPMFVITNTDPACYWLPNFLETVLSAHLWKPITSATKAKRIRKIFLRHAREFGEKDMGFVDWQGHDFSYRGMGGNTDAIMSGMGHLLSFNGTDTVPAILAAREYYGAPLTCGGSVPATEHSVMCAGTQDGEFATFKRLITETYKSGIVSIVSDTWDLWRVLTEYIPKLKPEILARDGKVVIRPDSGDPIQVVTGNPVLPVGSPEHVGAMQLLAQAMGTDGKGHINKAGLIYGDGMNEDRIDRILTGIREKGLSPFNFVAGVGSFTYEYTTRDEYNMAMKATAVKRAGKIIPIFKKPVTQSGEFKKDSLVGIPVVYREKKKDGSVGYFVRDHGTPEYLAKCAYDKVFENGKLLIEHKWDDIVRRVRS